MSVKDLLLGVTWLGLFTLVTLIYGVRDGEAYLLFRPLFISAAILAFLPFTTLLVFEQIRAAARRRL